MSESISNTSSDASRVKRGAISRPSNLVWKRPSCSISLSRRVNASDRLIRAIAFRPLPTGLPHASLSTCHWSSTGPSCQAFISQTATQSPQWPRAPPAPASASAPRSSRRRRWRQRSGLLFTATPPRTTTMSSRFPPSERPSASRLHPPRYASVWTLRHIHPIAVWPYPKHAISYSRISALLCTSHDSTSSGTCAKRPRCCSTSSTRSSSSGGVWASTATSLRSPVTLRWRNETRGAPPRLASSSRRSSWSSSSSSRVSRAACSPSPHCSRS